MYFLYSIYVISLFKDNIILLYLYACLDKNKILAILYNILYIIIIYKFQSQSERSDNTSLRIENAKMKSENLLLKGALKNIICLTCRGQTSEKEECNLTKQNLKLKNAMLHEEASKLIKLNHFD